ncbi:vegetative cell wall protein gp1-like [Papaver somniferum]|uniref:vegetative cell wall protein gp1-like n=1 Tax=Papaver somniferum TaxID=3469 RepID=UPI000E6FF725|nr:vegetative cell wall protein gp1-like [Papaver somniferum]
MSISVRNKGGKKASLACLFTTSALLVVIISLCFPFSANAVAPKSHFVPRTIKVKPRAPPPKDSAPSTMLPNLGKKSPAVPNPLPPPRKKPPTHSQDSAPSTILPNLGKISPAVPKPLPPPPNKSPPL